MHMQFYVSTEFVKKRKLFKGGHQIRIYGTHLWSFFGSV